MFEMLALLFPEMCGDFSCTHVGALWLGLCGEIPLGILEVRKSIPKNWSSQVLGVRVNFLG